MQIYRHDNAGERHLQLIHVLELVFQQVLDIRCNRAEMFHHRVGI